VNPYAHNPAEARGYIEWHKKGWEWFMLALTKEDLSDPICVRFMENRIFSWPSNEEGYADGQEVARAQVLRWLERLKDKSSRYEELRVLQERLHKEADPEIVRDVERDRGLR
jgi:hypothetical protein